MAEGGKAFSEHMEGVARLLWGAPNEKLSKKSGRGWTNLRWGDGGARSVDTKGGVWFDNAAKEGGGVLDLIERETGRTGGARIEWLRENGFQVPDLQRTNGRTNGAGHSPANGSTTHLDDGAPWLLPDDGVQSEAGEVVEYNPPGVPAEADLVRTFDYVDESGTLLFQVCRFEWRAKGQAKPEKTFRQRRPNGKGGWLWSVKDVRQVPYRLPEILEAIAGDLIVFVAEGEKAVDSIAELGVPATCNAGGAGKWPPSLTPLFAGARVVILPDNDDPGRRHRNLVAQQLSAVAASVSVLDLPNLPPKGDVADWIAAGGTVEELYGLAETQAVPWSEEIGFESKFHAVRWRDLDAPAPEHEWLIKGLLTRGERSMLAGPSQSGKSFLAIDLALSVARGEPFMGLRTLHGAVVYQAGEGGRGIRKRLRAYRLRHGLTADDDLPFVLLPSAVDLYASDDQTNDLIEEILFWKRRFVVPLELVVIDTLSAATPGANENASEDMSRVLARCARIADAAGAHVLLVHHMNAEGSKPRGHTSILANLDSVILCRKLDGLHDADKRAIREYKLLKQKDGEPDSIKGRFVLPAVVLGRDQDGDDITSCVVARPNEGLLAEVDYTADGGVRLSPQCEVLLRAIHHSVTDFGTSPPAGLRLPSTVRVVEWRHVVEAYERTTLEGDGEDETKRKDRVRKALKRHGEWLLARQIIGRQNPYVWLTGKRARGFGRTPAQSSTQLSSGPPADHAPPPSADDDMLPF